MSLVILCFFNKNLGVVAYKKLILLFLNMYPIIRNVLFLDYEYIITNIRKADASNIYL